MTSNWLIHRASVAEISTSIIVGKMAVQVSNLPKKIYVDTLGKALAQAVIQAALKTYLVSLAQALVVAAKGNLADGRAMYAVKINMPR